jgi:hypothetical protein
MNTPIVNVNPPGYDSTRCKRILRDFTNHVQNSGEWTAHCENILLQVQDIVRPQTGVGGWNPVKIAAKVSKACMYLMAEMVVWWCALILHVRQKGVMMGIVMVV